MADVTQHESVHSPLLLLLIIALKLEYFNLDGGQLRNMSRSFSPDNDPNLTLIVEVELHFKCFKWLPGF